MANSEGEGVERVTCERGEVRSEGAKGDGCGCSGVGVGEGEDER